MDRPPYLIGHTLDLISHGLSISLTEISETAISDHFPIIIEFPVLASTASRSLLHALMIFFHLFILLVSQSWTLLDRQSGDVRRTNYMSLEILKGCFSDYQRAVKVAKSKFLSHIITNSGHCPRVMFNTINSVVNQCTCPLIDASVSTCENFLHFINCQKLTSKSSETDLVVAAAHSVVFEQFELVSLSFLNEVVQHLKITNCPLDLVPTKLLK